MMSLAGLCAHAQGHGHAKTFFKPGNPHIAYTGRIEDSNPDRPVFSYPGVQIHCTFTGTSLSMEAKPRSGYFMVEIDRREPFKVLFAENSTMTLASNLPDRTHHATITYVGEGYDCLPEFRGLSVDSGKELLPPPPLPSRKIEFIGNSITCGYGIEANDPTAPYTEASANFYHTYAARTARNLRAQAMVVARSGIGVYRNYNGPRTGDKVNMNTEYPYTLLYNDTHAWDFSRYTPHVVCINLGTNDVSTEGADTLLLRQAFQTLYGQVRTHYPHARIVFLTGCMLSGDPLRIVRQTLDAVASYAHATGDTLVHRFDFPPQSGKFGYGAGYHPSMRQHELMAEELTTFLRQIMHWRDNDE